MADGPSAEDEALFARLNAIRPTNFSLRENAAPVLPSLHSESDDTPEDLINRFRQVQGRQAVKEDPIVREEGATEGDRPASPTIDELLAELGSEEQYTVKKSDLQEADDLLKEARTALPHGQLLDNNGFGSDRNTGEQKQVELVEHNQPPTEDEEADAALQRILDDAGSEGEEAASKPAPLLPASPQKSTVNPDAGSFASLQFPITPDNVFDDLALPSAPTHVPQSKVAKAGSRTAKSTDEETDSWCIICCADASVQCFGCNKDLYCWGCWREGHTGEGAGLEEKTHVWERWSKTKAG